jgi:hypothetical protein
MEKAKGGGDPGRNQHGAWHRSTGATAATLSDLGISRDQSSKWQQLVDVPEDQFEAAVAAPKNPSKHRHHRGSHVRMRISSASGARRRAAA